MSNEDITKVNLGNVKIVQNENTEDLHKLSSSLKADLKNPKSVTNAENTETMDTVCKKSANTERNVDISEANVENQENSIQNVQSENIENLQNPPTCSETDLECLKSLTNRETVEVTNVCTNQNDRQKNNECNLVNKDEDIESENVHKEINPKPPDNRIKEKISSPCKEIIENGQDKIFHTPSKSAGFLDDLKTEIPSPNHNGELCTSGKNLKRKQQTTSPTKCSPYLTDERENMISSPNKRKVSISSDYGYKCDTLKSEFSETLNLNDLEPMIFLHDLDTLIEFEDCKISEDILLSSMTSNNVTQDSTGDNKNWDKEPSSDPLCLEKDVEVQRKVYPQRKRKCIIDLKRSESLLLEEEEEEEEEEDEENDVSLAVRSIKKELQKIKDKEEFPLSIINRLRHLKIKLIHKVPPQHKIERNAGSHVPSKEERRIFFKYGPLRKGRCSPAEDQTIMNNWKEFCKIHDWDEKNVKPFLYMRHNGKYYIPQLEERQKFVQFLANGLPWRTLYTVYARFRCLVQPYAIKRTYGKYSSEEDKKIIAYMQNTSCSQNTKCSELAKILGRTRHSVWLHYQLLKQRHKIKVKGKSASKQKVRTKVKWTLSLIKLLIRHLLDITLSETVNDLKNAIIPKPVWEKLEKVLNIDAVLLKKFWLYQLHMQLFCPEPIYLNDIKIQLIEYMYGKGIAHIREIIWPNVAIYFNGMTSVFLCRTFFHLLRDCDMKITNNNLFDVVEYLYHEIIPQLTEDSMDKQLPRLRYNNKRVNLVDNQEC